MLATQVALKNSLSTIGIALLSIKRSSRHVGDHGVATSEWVLGGSQWVVPVSGLRVPDITAVTSKVARL